MNWKVILTVGVALHSGIISAQTSDSKPDKNQVFNQSRNYSDGQWMTVARRPYVADAGEVNRDLRAAKNGDTSAQFKLALRYDSGQGVFNP